MSTRPPSLWRVLSDTSRVIAARPGHFSALALLFILPNSILSIIYTFLTQPSSLHHSYYDYHRSLPSAEKPQILLPILYFLSVFLFSLCAAPSITFTAFHGFRGDPVSFISSLKSIPTSFLPLLATVFASYIIMWLIMAAFLVFMLLAYNGLALIGFEMDYHTNYFLILVILMTVLLFGFLIYLQVQWVVSTAVVVIESKWGFAPLKRSSYLMKGMKGVVFWLVIILAGVLVVFSVWFYGLVANVINGGLTGWGVVQMVIYACLSTFLSLYSLSANSVLFVYGKALHGEVYNQNDEEIGRQYVQLPFDDGVAPYVYRS